MKNLVWLGFYSIGIKKLHVVSKPFFKLIRNDTFFKWHQNMRDFFEEEKRGINADTIITIPIQDTFSMAL